MQHVLQHSDFKILYCLQLQSTLMCSHVSVFVVRFLNFQALHYIFLSFNFVWHVSNAVSYTHLDVYKRQAYTHTSVCVCVCVCVLSLIHISL